MNVPKLRFKEFNDEWNITLLKDFFSISAGGDIDKNHLRTDEDENFKYPVYANALTNNGLYGFSDIYKVEGNTITVTGRGDIGYAIARDEKYYPIVRLLVLKSDNNFNNYFFANAINNIKLIQESTGVPQLTSPQIGKYKISYPTINEQTKIGKMLNLLDKKIELQSKKIEDLKLFKSYTKIELFKNYDNQKKLKDILVKWNKKNKDNSIDYVESISNKYGFIAQSEQFEDRNVASKDLSKYYIIEKNVFGYNPSRLNVGSLALKLDDNVSVVSPLYECFTTTENNKFLLEWFDSIYFKKETISKFEGGVRNTLNFSNLCEISINLPSSEKQYKYATILSDFDKKIKLEEVKLDKLNELKKGLMQNMFV